MIESITREVIRENRSDLEFCNMLGLIFENHFIIYNTHQKITIQIEEIQHIKIRKIRKNKKNVFLIVLAAGFLFSIYFTDFCLTNTLILSGISSFFFACGILFKEYRYTFIIFRTYDFVEIEIINIFKNEAKVLERLLNKKLQKFKSTR